MSFYCPTLDQNSMIAMIASLNRTINIQVKSRFQNVIYTHHTGLAFITLHTLICHREALRTSFDYMTLSV